MPDRKPKVTLVILNWNGRSDTERCLQSVARLDYQPLDVILVDNGSVDGSGTFFKAHYPWVTLIENGVNLGFCEGNNVGIRRALAEGADYVMLLNNDATLQPDALSRLVAVGEADPRIGILGPKTYQGDGTILRVSGPDWLPNIGLAADTVGGDLVQDVPVVAGHAFLIKRHVLEMIGLLDPDYFAYYEEVDFCMRARGAGFTCRLVADALAWHKGQGSNAGLLRPYLIHRNQLLYVRKRATPRQRLLFLTHYLLYLAPRTALTHLLRGRFALLGIFVKAVLWHAGLFRHGNPLAAQLRATRVK